MASEVEPGVVLIAPGGKHLTVKRRGGQVIVPACPIEPADHSLQTVCRCHDELGRGEPIGHHPGRHSDRNGE